MNKVVGVTIQRYSVCGGIWIDEQGNRIVCGKSLAKNERWCQWCGTVNKSVKMRTRHFYIQPICTDCGKDISSEIECFLHVSGKILPKHALLLSSRKLEKEEFKILLEEILDSHFLCYDCNVKQTMMTENCTEEKAEELLEEYGEYYECACPL